MKKYYANSHFARGGGRYIFTIEPRAPCRLADLLAGEAVEGDGAAPVRHTEDVVGLVPTRVPAQAPDSTRLPQEYVVQQPQVSLIVPNLATSVTGINLFFGLILSPFLSLRISWHPILPWKSQ